MARRWRAARQRDCRAPGQLLAPSALSLWSAGYLIFALSFLSPRFEGVRWLGVAGGVWSAAMQTAGAAFANFAVQFPVTGVPLNAVLFVIAAGRWASVSPLPTALGVVAAQCALHALTLAGKSLSVGTIAIVSGSFLGFQLFALFVAHIAERERRTRIKLLATLVELRGTQELLAEGSRLAERARIARDLHDALGHHLAALALNLEAAIHQSGDEARAALAHSRGLAARLLAEVREVVHNLRSEEAIDLRCTFDAMARMIPAPRVHIEVGKDCLVRDPAVAQTLLRVAQELLTNSIKHASAANFWLELHSERRLETRGACDRLVLCARDDGMLANGHGAGLGLLGIEERVRELGGRVEMIAVGAEHAESGGVAPAPRAKCVRVSILVPEELF